MAPSRKGVASEHTAGCQALDRTNADDVAKAGGTEHGCMSHPTEEGGVGKSSAFVGVLNRGLADHDGNHIAEDHHQGDLGRPGHGGGSDREKVGQHSSQ